MKKKDKKFYIKIGIALLVILFLLYKSPQSTGSVYAPDMSYSNALETFAEGPLTQKFGKNEYHMASLMPVENTVSRNSLPSSELYQSEKSVVYSYNYTRFFKNTEEDKARAGSELRNPYQPTDDVLKRGKIVYNKQCAVCHGEKGMGDGPLIVRADGSDGAYKSIPPSYADRLITLKDGEIYHSIVYGKNMMGGYASHVNADDRWKLICYIKELGGLNPARAEEASENEEETAEVEVETEENTEENN